MTNSSPATPRGLAAAVARTALTAARHPKLTIALWLALIAGCTGLGAATGMKSLSDARSGTGQSERADLRLAASGLAAPAVESILVRSGSPASTAAAVRQLEDRARRIPTVAAVRGPQNSPALSKQGGRTELVQIRLRGDPNNAGDHVAPLESLVASAAAQHPGVALAETGDASGERAINQVVNNGLRHVELISLPVTLLILVLAFGSLVAASVPLLLGLTSVAAALGALGAVSQLVPMGDSTSSVVVVVGLAVGIDYSLFYVRREREERRAGRSDEAATAAAAATVGRAVVVAGLTVMIALAGFAFTGLGVFTSMALGTILVVAIAVLGSVTVLPAVLALLGPRVERGRIWPRRKTRGRDRPAITTRGLTKLARAVTSHPVAALTVATCVLAALAVPVLHLHTANPGSTDLPANTPVLVAQRAIERAFPGGTETAELVITGRHLNEPAATAKLTQLGRAALAVTGGHGATGLSIARNGETALVTVPMPTRGLASDARLVDALRTRILPQAGHVSPGAQGMLTGDAADSVDFSNRLKTVTPIVIGIVLALAFMLLLAAFGSVPLAASVIGLNLLSVGAAFGMLVLVFQHRWAQALLGFTSNGTIASWLPLFAFVLLFGLSMDYTVLVLERAREARQHGATARAAAAEALASTAGTVTSAAAVMIAVFAIFASLSLLEFKQLGVGLALAIALDATIVRAIALPAVITLLGERGWRIRGDAGSSPPPADAPAVPAGRYTHPVAANRPYPRAPRTPARSRARRAAGRFFRDLLYLTNGLGTSVLAFAAVVGGLTASLVLAPLIIGLPVILLTAAALRGVATLDRLNARLVLGRRLRSRYRPQAGQGVLKRTATVLRDPQTWRDLGWSIVHTFTGFGFGVAALSSLAAVLGGLTLPLWYWAPSYSSYVGLWPTNTLPGALAVVPVAILALPVLGVLVRLMALAETRLATALLDDDSNPHSHVTTASAAGRAEIMAPAARR